MAKSKEIKTDCGLIIVECETTPPSRYSEATLVKKLETTGIGRPSTYAGIVTTLLDPGRGYCEEQGKAIAPTEKGILLVHFLKEAFPKIVDYSYTANLEAELDLIAKGKKKQLDFLNDFYSDLETQIKNTKSVIIEKPKAEGIGRNCPDCGKPLVKRIGRFGPFAGCSGYPKCKHMEKL